MSADTSSGETMPPDPPYGFYIVLAGLSALVLIAVIAILRYRAANDVTSVTTSAGAVIGTVIGAFFGVSVGQAGRKRAEHAKDQAQQLAIQSTNALVKVAAQAPPDSEAAKAAVAAVS
jgi:hypothetical protein